MTGAKTWARDLALGARFAAAGGRQGWTRTLLTALGVGLGVTLLLFAASVPAMLDARHARSTARDSSDEYRQDRIKKADDTLLYAPNNTTYRDTDVHGVILRAEGPKAPKPPGVAAIPGDGEMLVSPALRTLLASPDGALLRERLGGRIVGTIGDAGLTGPSELAYYSGSDTLTQGERAYRIKNMGATGTTEQLNGFLLLLIVMICVVLLMPVAVFIATAVRFGSEARDRRLAALRLVGADTATTHRVAGGEALLGSLAGLLLGAGFFLAGRQFTGLVNVWNFNAFPSDVSPSPLLTALIALAVPASAVVVTFLALRRTAIEPLGVVRNAAGRRRKLWWRLLLPVAGLGLLLPMSGDISESDTTIGTYQIAFGAVLVLVGVTALLPWGSDAVIRRFKGGPVSWQLAIRRLQLSSDTASRAVSGITVAVAGAIALQMLFAGVSGALTKKTGQDPNRAQLTVSQPVSTGAQAQRIIEDFRATPGVRSVLGTVTSSATRPGKLLKGEDYLPTTSVYVADCATLRELARITSCRDGDTFIATGEGFAADGGEKVTRPGKAVDLNPSLDGDKPSAHPVLWTLPATARTVRARTDPKGFVRTGILATPSALPVTKLQAPEADVMLRLDPKRADAADQARNTAARIDPRMDVETLTSTVRGNQFATVQKGLLVGSTVTMLLIAASMLVSLVEQLRERKRLLAVLIAFGTRRSTLGWSVLWQTAVPVVIGLALAVIGGLGLGAALLTLVDVGAADWTAFLPIVGIGAGVIAVVTLLSLPPLWRMMRPDGLRTE
jgi:ABC-type antimicrobial peptide transport system permease subunit